MKKLRAGALVVGYENGFLRRIMYGETEVLRMIYFASRDHNWNTLNHEVQNEVISEGDHSFEITYDCKHREGTEVVIEWKVRISGAADGTISFKITGSPVRSFRKNRVGFCLLHPRSIAGSGCRIIDPEGKAHDTAFPEVIARDNPFTRVQSMEWSAAETPFRVDFEGDVFETEDQRNWGDASFKTFCTPLDRPFPVEIDAGGAIAQQIIFKPLHPLGSVGHSTKRVELFPSAFAGFMPWVGINAPASATDKLSDAAVVLLRALRLHHYRLDLSPSEPDWVSAFSSGYETAYGLGLPLEVALHLSENFAEEIEAFSVLCQQNNVRLRTVMLMRKDAHITDQRVTSLIPGLKVLFRNVAFGVGTNHNFTEINRNPIDATHADFICFAMDPQ